MAEDKKKKVTIGYKKLKNVDSFDQFDIHKEELQGGVNESSNFDSDFNELLSTLNYLDAMRDEGYIKNGNWAVGFEDLSNEQTEGRFTNDAEMDKWLTNILPIVVDITKDFTEKTKA